MKTVYPSHETLFPVGKFGRPPRLTFARVFAFWLGLLSPLGAQEFRALWADAFHTGYLNSAQTTTLVAAARAAKCNAIIVEVRKRGDAYYRNGLEPVATNVANGYDPLADLITKAHDTSGGQRIEIHAWIVSFNIWSSDTSNPTQPSHPFNLHPDWLSQKIDGTQFDGDNFYFDPGHPAVQQHTYDVCMDIVMRYHVDGIHFDYIRYPDSGSSGGNQPWGYNPVSVARYNRLKNKTGTPAATDATWLQWRRDQISALVRKVYLNTWAVKPTVRVSASLIAYDPAPVTDANWLTSAPYSRVLQDWRGWLEEGILDLGCQMVYKTSNASVTNWTSFIRDRQYNRASAIGLGWYLNPVATTITQIGIARGTSAGGKKAAGVLGFSYAVPNNEDVPPADMWTSLAGAGGPFASTATIPTMPWKTSATLGHAMGIVRAADTNTAIDGATISITGPQNRTLTADATGFFGAVDLPVGNYTLTINQPGFRPLSRSFTVTASTVAQPATNLEIVPFQVTSATRTAGTLTITWNAVPGRSYRVEKSNNLTQPWAPAVSGLVASGTSASYQWTIPAGWEQQGYLRVVRE